MFWRQWSCSQLTIQVSKLKPTSPSPQSLIARVTLVRSAEMDGSASRDGSGILSFPSTFAGELEGRCLSAHSLHLLGEMQHPAPETHSTCRWQTGLTGKTTRALGPSSCLPGLLSGSASSRAVLEPLCHSPLTSRFRKHSTFAASNSEIPPKRSKCCPTPPSNHQLNKSKHHLVRHIIK